MRYYMVKYSHDGMTKCMAIFAIRQHAENYCTALQRSRRYASAQIEEVIAKFDGE